MPGQLENYCSTELLHDLYESWLILFAAIFLRYNQCRLLSFDPASPLDPLYAAPVDDNQRWSDVFLASGIVLAILEYRPLWVRRCRHRIRLLMLLAEIVLVLQLTEWMDRQVWQPFLCIVRDLFAAMGRAEWASWMHHYLPAVCQFFASGHAFKAFRLLSSFAVCCSTFHSSVENWRHSMDFLILGCVPRSPLRNQLIHEANQRWNTKRKRNGQPPTPSPETLIYRRLCSVCRRDRRCFPRSAQGL
ncbi:uncharacterized protein LOC108088673 [Drosophila ficusphila]|uniref:uncharacterized protein LOC108088673 n=1 Tax=Drosophila ficusphila TaxID=30025 RepID=UPI0007E7FBC3|nr:uncharacterized protein LOC108088673 [Drosophila ficusphila]